MTYFDDINKAMADAEHLFKQTYGPPCPECEGFGKWGVLDDDCWGSGPCYECSQTGYVTAPKQDIPENVLFPFYREDFEDEIETEDQNWGLTPDDWLGPFGNK